MRRLKVSMENPGYARLRATKALVDYLVGEELSWDTYVGLVVDLGLTRIVVDVTGSADNPILKGTLEKMHEKNPAFVADFVLEQVKLGSEAEKKEIKGKLGFLK